MGLENLLAQKRREILKAWFNLVIKSYPEDTAAFFKQNKDHFANPVGSTIKRGLEAILKELFKETDHAPETLRPIMDPIIRIRAVQDFKPSEAVSFIFSLKPVIREMAHKAFGDENVEQELHVLDSKIDSLGLMGFDIYMMCREKIYDLKANEFRNRTYRAFERANLISENSPE